MLADGRGKESRIIIGCRYLVPLVLLIACVRGLMVAPSALIMLHSRLVSSKAL